MLEWTKEPPTESGEYLCRRDANPEGSRKAIMVGRVLVVEGEPLWVFNGSSLAGHVNSYSDAEWAGPIPEPKEPGDA